MIKLRNLDFRYPGGVFHLRVPALDVRERERVAIVGASGSGKTTMLNLLAGIILPTEGAIEVAAHRLSTLSDSDRRTFRISRIGLIFQAFELLEYLTVRDNLLLPYRISPALEESSDTRAQLERLAAETGITDRLERRPDELSQGERQRAAICRALITAPQLILADEPTGNLDPDNKRRVLDLLLAQVAGHGATLVMVTHDHDLLDPFDRVIDMRDFHGGESP
ncbi:MAG: ABC transporter ATP-binding protein [Chromatiales bacterium]|nr:ABC transporter ATP-binding protein [Chromatiales bacterium]